MDITQAIMKLFQVMISENCKKNYRKGRILHVISSEAGGPKL